MTLVEGEELQRLWALVSELSSQLSSNRELCHSLQAQANELKGQALHTGTGYTLRRFNLDISKEKFESELEKLNSHLVMENQSLTHENKQINILLREYENTLETIMSKFRSFSVSDDYNLSIRPRLFATLDLPFPLLFYQHATQQHTLSLTSHYETLLANDANQSESTSLHASTSFSNTLAHLGGLVRLALREVEGEGIDSDDEDDVKDSDPFEAEGYRVGSPSGIGPSSLAESSSKGHGSNTKRAKTGYGSAPSRDPRWYGTGGYTGLQGDPEAEKAEKALQARTEEERLRKENETLRELLRISTDITPEIAREFGIEIPAPTTSTSWSSVGLNAGKLSLGKARGSRKSIIEATLPVKSIESETAESALKTEDDQENIPDEESILQDLKPMKSSWPDMKSASSIGLSSSDKEDAKPSSDATSTSLPPTSIEHILEGSGGPPQLKSILDEHHTEEGADVKAASQVKDIGIGNPDVLRAEKTEGELQPTTSKQAGLQDTDIGMWQAEDTVMDPLEANGMTAMFGADIDVANDKANLRSKLLDEIEDAIQQTAEPKEETTSAIA